MSRTKASEGCLTVFRLSLELFFLASAEGSDLGQAYDVCDGVFDASAGGDQANGDAEPQPAIIYPLRHDLVRVSAA